MWGINTKVSMKYILLFVCSASHCMQQPNEKAVVTEAKKLIEKVKYQEKQVQKELLYDLAFKKQLIDKDVYVK